MEQIHTYARMHALLLLLLNLHHAVCNSSPTRQGFYQLTIDYGHGVNRLVVLTRQALPSLPFNFRIHSNDAVNMDNDILKPLFHHG